MEARPPEAARGRQATARTVPTASQTPSRFWLGAAAAFSSSTSQTSSTFEQEPIIRCQTKHGQVSQRSGKQNLMERAERAAIKFPDEREQIKHIQGYRQGNEVTEVQLGEVQVWLELGK